MAMLNNQRVQLLNHQELMIESLKPHKWGNVMVWSSNGLPGAPEIGAGWVLSVKGVCFSNSIKPTGKEDFSEDMWQEFTQTWCYPVVWNPDS